MFPRQLYSDIPLSNINCCYFPVLPYRCLCLYKHDRELAALSGSELKVNSLGTLLFPEEKI
jgi:hypothetical protein